MRRAPRKPGVWTWYVMYCVAMALMYLGVMIGGFVLASLPAELGERPESSQAATELRAMSGLFIGLGLLFFLPFAAAPFLPRKPWAWVYGIVLICVGMTSVCCMIASIPLLLFWIKPETKAWFGMGDGIETAPVPGAPRGRGGRDYS